MTSEELSAMWKELRPQIGNFMCRLDNEVKFIEVHHDEYVTKEDHELGCDEFYDVGKNSRESEYKWCIHRLYDLEESELFELFGEDCPMDVLRIFSIDHILGILTDYFDKQKQIEEEAARDAAKHEIDEWYKDHLEEIKQAETPHIKELEKLAIKRTFLIAQFKERKRALGLEDDE